MTRTVRQLAAAGLSLFLFAFHPAHSANFIGRTVAELPSLIAMRSTAAQSKTKASASTEDLYRTNCARCHGADGRGDTPLGHTYNSPDFTDEEWWRKHSDITGTKSLASIITNGKGGMPAFGKKLKSAEIKGLVNYVRKFRRVK
jgi:mono/diheme cytochrome c family protein